MSWLLPLQNIWGVFLALDNKVSVRRVRAATNQVCAGSECIKKAVTGASLQANVLNFEHCTGELAINKISAININLRQWKQIYFQCERLR